jgi:hypothetical protein
MEHKVMEITTFEMHLYSIITESESKVPLCGEESIPGTESGIE